MDVIWWSFFEREQEVYKLSEDVAYSWTCLERDDPNHTHVIECLWIWHNCDLNLKPVNPHWTSLYVGWKPTGVGLHDLISAEPLHIEASVYWPECCGMHGFIRNGVYESV